ncbi:MAG TPA: twin-arginine translocase TatA/TatE family subunit [Candidatus Dormibacteraeota bacterium]|jgi:TatA/E family protein of Tat protein translocase|nr:twin-arginine translocase TatA/TatE family subunit [Candidatus Dormibacteraeota bacterium]
MHWAFIVVIILVIVLIIFGPRRLTKLGGALGQSVREFRKENSAPDGTNPSTKDKPG